MSVGSLVLINLECGKLSNDIYLNLNNLINLYRNMNSYKAIYNIVKKSNIKICIKIENG